MFRHVVLLTLLDSASDADRDRILAGLAELPERVPSIRGYVFGSDVGASEGNADIAVVADFDDRAGWELYRDHEAHLAVIEEHIRPVLESRTAVQFEW